jgi:hypothetical protein
MPQAMLGKEVIKKALLLACRAPSVHNSQPWHWVSEGAVLRLVIDRRRWVRSADRSGREAVISCGAVLDHLRIAMVAAGWQAHIDRFPNPNNQDLWHQSNSAHSNSSPTLSAHALRRFCSAEPTGFR